jgi:hemoglobin
MELTVSTRTGSLRLTIGALLLCLCGAMAHADDSLFVRMGGEAKLNAAVDELVEVMLADERINFVFAQTDLAKFKQRLYSQLCELAAGPCIYDGRDMRSAHAGLPITNAQFNALTEDLYIAFDRVGIAYALQNEMIALLAPMQRDIVRK